MIGSKNVWGALVGLAFVILGAGGAANGKVGPSIALIGVGLVFAGWHLYHLAIVRRNGSDGPTHV